MGVMRMADQWFVYIIEYHKNKLYTGITTDVERRFAEHSSGSGKAARALRGKGPYSLVYVEKAANRSEASVRECEIKKMTRQQKLALVEAAVL